MNCDRHPKNPSWWGDKRSCYECAKDNYAQTMIDRDLGKMDNPNRNYATGLGKEAHREAQEAGRFDQQLQEGKLNAKVRKYL